MEDKDETSFVLILRCNKRSRFYKKQFLASQYYVILVLGNLRLAVSRRLLIKESQYFALLLSEKYIDHLREEQIINYDIPVSTLEVSCFCIFFYYFQNLYLYLYLYPTCNFVLFHLPFHCIFFFFFFILSVLNLRYI